MRRLAFTVVPLLPLLLACDQQPAAPDAVPGPAFRGAAELVVTTAYADFDYPATLSCINEGFHMSGTFTVFDRYVTLPNGVVQDQWVLRLGDDWVFVGNSSGQVWDLQPGYNQVAVFRFEGPPWAVDPSFIAFHEHMSWKSRASGAVMDLPLRSHFVRNAAGEVKVDRFEIGDCRLHP